MSSRADMTNQRCIGSNFNYFINQEKISWFIRQVSWTEKETSSRSWENGSSCSSQARGKFWTSEWILRLNERRINGDVFLVSLMRSSCTLWWMKRRFLAHRCGNDKWFYHKQNVSSARRKIVCVSQHAKRRTKWVTMKFNQTLQTDSSREVDADDLSYWWCILQSHWIAFISNKNTPESVERVWQVESICSSFASEQWTRADAQSLRSQWVILVVDWCCRNN